MIFYVYVNMEDVLSGLGNLDFTLDIKDLLTKEQDSCELVLVAHVVIERFINLDAFFRVFLHVWVKKGGLKFKVID